jgi:(p)ppGpp synthase/HD superfamily hydrolase
MAASLVRAARLAGMGSAHVARINTAHALAMGPRVARLDSQRHPAYLHPGHTILILMRDAGVVDPTLLAAAALVESEDGDLRIGLDRIRAVVGDDIASVVEAVPLPGRAELAEELVVAPEGVRLVALAERLDQARHAHLREADRVWKAALLEEVARVYLPVAERTHAKLATRFRHWSKAFGRRLEVRTATPERPSTG